MVIRDMKDPPVYDSDRDRYQKSGQNGEERVTKKKIEYADVSGAGSDQGRHPEYADCQQSFGQAVYDRKDNDRYMHDRDGDPADGDETKPAH